MHLMTITATPASTLAVQNRYYLFIHEKIDVYCVFFVGHVSAINYLEMYLSLLVQDAML